MRRVTMTNLLFWDNLPKLQGTVPLMYVLNAKPLFMSWRRSSSNEVNDWAPKWSNIRKNGLNLTQDIMILNLSSNMSSWNVTNLKIIWREWILIGDLTTINVVIVMWIMTLLEEQKHLLMILGNGRDMYLRREMWQLLMDLDFDPLFQCWGEFYL